MKAHRAFLAVEGGGSTGQAALEYGDCTLISLMHRGLNPVDIGERAFEERLQALVLPLLDHLDTKPASIRACVALAGAGRAGVARSCKRTVTKMLTGSVGRTRVRVLSDADALVECFLHRRSGIALIAGTGSICMGVRHQGTRMLRARVGGWGAYFDDGSGFRIGMALLSAALAAVDGRQAPNAAVNLLCRRYGVKLDEIPVVFLPPERDRIAELAGVVLESYELGDPFARVLVRNSVRDLTGMVVSVSKRLRLAKRAPVYVSGGLFRSPVVMRLFRSRLKRTLPGAALEEIQHTLPHILHITHQNW
jgi:N-acetylglucosamine kinase-like BadF-type ATPase